MFDKQYDRLLEKVRVAQKTDPVHFRSHPAFKLLAAIDKLTEELIPGNPSAPQFRRGNTLGKYNRHWFRAKFHERYRLFFRFSTKDKAMVYVWMSDKATLRQGGSKTGPYALFEAMLRSGTPPEDFENLLAASRKMP